MSTRIGPTSTRPTAKPFDGSSANSAGFSAKQQSQLTTLIGDLLKVLNQLTGGAPGKSGGTLPGNGLPSTGAQAPGNVSKSAGAPGSSQVAALEPSASASRGTDGFDRGVKTAKDLVSTQSPPDKVYPELAQDQAGLGQQKQSLWDAARSGGASQEEASILVAQMMQEGGRDSSKDAKGGAANYGPLNLNGELLTRFGGVAQGDLSKLNAGTPEAERKTVDAALTAMRSMGVDNYLHHVRGGSTGYEDPSKRISNNPKVTDDDTDRFARNIGNAAGKLLADYKVNPASMGNDKRIAADIPGI